MKCPLCEKPLSSYRKAAEHFMDSHNGRFVPGLINYVDDVPVYGMDIGTHVMWCFCRYKAPSMGLSGFLGRLNSRDEAAEVLAKHFSSSGGVEKHFNNWLLRLVKGD